eukprot:m.11919 g.11919  ORF g.11919 m.11919 type:complete len:239 (+) comp4488_c0_seq2:653-1369(+)
MTTLGNGVRRAAAVASWHRHTQLVTVPDLGGASLRLITPDCDLYRTDARGLPDGWGLPWWGFVWPGGWGVARHLFLHPNLVRGRGTVLDLCAGCGLGAIIALQAGADSVIANDICEMACIASEENARLNQLAPSQLRSDSRNLIGSEELSLGQGDLVLVGDALYDAGLAAELLPWLQDLATRGVDVYLGDPGRWVLTEMDASERSRLMTTVATYALPQSLADEHHGITAVGVHKLRPC